MPWTDGMPAEDLGAAQNLGWASLDGEAAAKAAFKSYRELEKFKGAPPDRLITLPTEDTPDAWKPVHQKLGVPDKPEGYTDIPDELKPIAHAANLTPRQAKAWAEQVAAQAAAAKTAADAAAAQAATNAAAEKTAKETQLRGTNVAALDTEWGAEATKNRLAAERQLSMAGYTAEEIAGLAATDKYLPTMKRMLALAKATNELDLVAGGGSLGPGQRSVEAIRAEKEEIMAKFRNSMQNGSENAAAHKRLAELAAEEVAARHRGRT